MLAEDDTEMCDRHRDTDAGHPFTRMLTTRSSLPVANICAPDRMARPPTANDDSPRPWRKVLRALSMH